MYDKNLHTDRNITHRRNTHQSMNMMNIMVHIVYSYLSKNPHQYILPMGIRSVSSYKHHLIKFHSHIRCIMLLMNISCRIMDMWYNTRFNPCIHYHHILIHTIEFLIEYWPKHNTFVHCIQNIHDRINYWNNAHMEVNTFHKIFLL